MRDHESEIEMEKKNEKRKLIERLSVCERVRERERHRHGQQRESERQQDRLKPSQTRPPKSEAVTVTSVSLCMHICGSHLLDSAPIPFESTQPWAKHWQQLRPLRLGHDRGYSWWCCCSGQCWPHCCPVVLTQEGTTQAWLCVVTARGLV